ncbi:hypothetical protein EYR36_005112 [Pleurotus pulmonarius]|nr:hypothetical protein EYR36_005112 [Pleurotus pulmonarius]
MSTNAYADLPRYIANYYLSENLGSGYSGSIYRAHHLHSGKVVALKVQDVNHECPTNRYERRLYPLLQGGVGMPTLYTAGVEGKWDYLAIDLLGSSLDQLYRRSKKETMDLRSVCCIAMQVIARLEFMHSRGVLHRDIQLGNCVIGLPPNEKTIYMIDFGFSKQYIDPHTRRHIPDSKAKRDFIGNYWFSSVGVHCRGKVPSRRDDLEAVALMLIHLLTPRGLPWTRNGVPKTDEEHERLKRNKSNARPEDLCRNLPEAFEDFLRYCKSLKFMDRPDYERWIDEFRDLAVDSGFPDSDQFIWPPPPPPITSVKTPPPFSPIKLPRTIVPPRTVVAQDVENILRGLGNLALVPQPALQDKSPMRAEVNQRAVENAYKEDSVHRAAPKPIRVHAVIEISSGSEDEKPHMLGRTPKAYRLDRLAAKLGSATDNARLAAIVLEFIQVLKGYNSSRALTKEGFAFLDALHKQLSDPSVFVLPMRTSRSRSSNSGLPIDQKQPAHVKLGVVARLKRDVQNASSSRALAKMVSDFGTVTNKSSGRTITKDGFAFLEGLAARLETLR